MTLTGAGATFPYKKDPKDSNIRIAPSFPTPEEMAMATDLFVLCVKMVSVDKLLKTGKYSIWMRRDDKSWKNSSVSAVIW